MQIEKRNNFNVISWHVYYFSLYRACIKHAVQLSTFYYRQFVVSCKQKWGQISNEHWTEIFLKQKQSSQNCYSSFIEPSLKGHKIKTKEQSKLSTRASPIAWNRELEIRANAIDNPHCCAQIKKFFAQNWFGLWLLKVNRLLVVIAGCKHINKLIATKWLTTSLPFAHQMVSIVVVGRWFALDAKSAQVRAKFQSWMQQCRFGNIMQQCYVFYLIFFA